MLTSDYNLTHALPLCGSIFREDGLAVADLIKLKCYHM